MTITVSEVNVAPVLAAIGTKSVDELATLRFTVSADGRGRAGEHADLQRHGPAGGGQLRSGHAGVPLDAERRPGPGSYDVTFTVSDGTAGDSEVVTITVSEVNVAPVLAAIGTKSVAELATLTFTVSATDVDLPANTLTFSATGLPAGASFDPATRVFRLDSDRSAAGNLRRDVRGHGRRRGPLADSERRSPLR